MHQAIYKRASLVAGIATALLFLTKSQIAMGGEYSDRDVTQAVERALYFDRLGGSENDVDVSTQDGVVTLGGTVDNLLAESRVVAITESVRNVLGVVDLITVKPEHRPDDAIRANIESALKQDPATESYRVSVSVRDGVVTLTGQTGSYAEKNLAGRLAEGVRGVKQIRNDIAINYLAPRTDREIALDVNSRLQWDVWLDGADVRAAVTNGVVTLTGDVRSVISKARAAEDAWVNGVVAVNDQKLRVNPHARMALPHPITWHATPDGEIKKAVLNAFRLDPRLAAFSPSVSVEDGVVILAGVVGNVKASEAAGEDAQSIVGVWRVQNFLKVRPAEQLSDSQLEEELKAALFWDPVLAGAKIETTVINRVAYLSGAVESPLEKSEAQDVASRIKGLVLVRNHLNVMPYDSIYYHDWPYYPYDEWTYYNQPPYAIAEPFGPDRSDKDIKREIERSFFWSPFVDRSDIGVKVESGVAILTGTVHTWIGWNEASRDAREHAAFVINHIKVERPRW